ncbi:hypothetical protein GCM10020001_068530 [Nonomuraea salmonea]
MGGGQVGAGVDAQLLVEQFPGLLVDGQGLGLTAAAVQGAHELGAQPFAQRVGGGEAGQLGHQLPVPSEREVGLDAVLGGGQAQLLQSGSGGLGVRGVGERRAVPQVEPGAQQRRGPLGVAAGQRLPPVADEQLEAAGVDVLGVGDQPVAGRVELDAVAAQRPPQPGDLGLQRVGHALGRAGAVHAVHQMPGGDDAARVEGEQGQQGAYAGPAQLHRLAVRLPRGGGSEDLEAHTSDYPGSRATISWYVGIGGAGSPRTPSAVATAAPQRGPVEQRPGAHPGHAGLGQPREGRTTRLVEDVDRQRRGRHHLGDRAGVAQSRHEDPVGVPVRADPFKGVAGPQPARVRTGVDEHPVALGGLDDALVQLDRAQGAVGPAVLQVDARDAERGEAGHQVGHLGGVVAEPALDVHGHQDAESADRLGQLDRLGLGGAGRVRSAVNGGDAQARRPDRGETVGGQERGGAVVPGVGQQEGVAGPVQAMEVHGTSPSRTPAASASAWAGPGQGRTP